jgi:hypothetical protein
MVPLSSFATSGDCSKQIKHLFGNKQERTEVRLLFSMACLHEAKFVAALYVALVIKKRRNRKIKCVKDWVKRCSSLEHIPYS